MYSKLWLPNYYSPPISCGKSWEIRVGRRHSPCCPSSPWRPWQRRAVRWQSGAALGWVSWAAAARGRPPRPAHSRRLLLLLDAELSWGIATMAARWRDWHLAAGFAARPAPRRASGVSRYRKERRGETSNDINKRSLNGSTHSQVFLRGLLHQRFATWRLVRSLAIHQRQPVASAMIRNTERFDR